MKRTGLRRKTALRSRTPLRRRTVCDHGWLIGIGPGACTAGCNPTRSPIARGRASGRARPDQPLADWCEARIDSVCTGRAAHRHHVKRRAQGGSDDASNTRDLCHACHEHVHANTAWAYSVGLLERSSVDRTLGTRP